MLTQKVKESIDKCILCWVGTISKDGFPNVSPREVFTYFDDDHLIIANIASPRSVKNLKANPEACVSFVDVLVQKGFKVYGKADIIAETDPEYEILSPKLLAMTKGAFPFQSITKIQVSKVLPIIAPSYLFYPDTKEEDQIAAAKKAYNLE